MMQTQPRKAVRVYPSGKSGITTGIIGTSGPSNCIVRKDGRDS
jgi:hypothetical protein